MAFKQLDPEDFVVSSDSVTTTVWSNNSPSLNTFFSSSTQTEGSSGPYYVSVYQTASGDDTAAIQFQIAYANKNGGGGVNFDSSVPFKNIQLLPDFVFSWYFSLNSFRFLFDSFGSMLIVITW